MNEVKITIITNVNNDEKKELLKKIVVLGQDDKIENLSVEIKPKIYLDGSLSSK